MRGTFWEPPLNRARRVRQGPMGTPAPTDMAPVSGAGVLTGPTCIAHGTYPKLVSVNTRLALLNPGGIYGIL